MESGGVVVSIDPYVTLRGAMSELNKAQARIAELEAFIVERFPQYTVDEALRLHDARRPTLEADQ